MNNGWSHWRQTGTGVLGLVTLAAGAMLLAPQLRADDAAQAARSVRLSNVEGQVKVSEGGQVLAEEAVANTPLFEGAQVATSDEGRAEIQFEDGSVARVSPNSSLVLSVLRGQDGGSETEITLESGLGYFELQSGSSSGKMRVRFGDSMVTASGFTVLRINLDSGPGELAVFNGNAHLERGSALALDLHGGESVALNAADPAHYNLAESIEPDSWDTWNTDRDEALQSEYSARTGATSSMADSNNPGWADLDANGSWYNVPGTGYVWSPFEASSGSWQPYGLGYWMWTPRFGYIWVSGNAWGYLPYQCGMWDYFDDFGWAWAPGISFCRNMWGFGFGGWGANIGNGPKGYVPPRLPRPHRPIGRNSQAGARSGYPLIAVNTHMAAVSGLLPSRSRHTPVVIGGQPVLALRPMAARSPYERASSGPQTTVRPGFPGARSPGPARAAGSGYNNRPGSAPAQRSNGGGSRAPASSRSSSSGGSSSSRISSSGGGGSVGGGGGSHSGGGSSGGGSHH
jgi:hypothetical protein